MGLEDMDGLGGDRCTATYGGSRCRLRTGHALHHHASGEIRWCTDPDRTMMEKARQMERADRALSRRNLPSAPAFLNTETGVLQASLQDCLVAAVDEVKPAGVRLVGVVVRGSPARWWWRWAEPVALWLLRRAGFEVCR